MDTLPSDVLLVIVHKLATQDPLALLTATCACKAFFCVIKDNPGVWKDLFHGSKVGQRTETNGRTEEGKQSSGLDAEIESLGGYKLLVAAQYARKMAIANYGPHGQISAEQNQAKRRCKRHRL